MFDSCRFICKGPNHQIHISSLQLLFREGTLHAQALRYLNTYGKQVPCFVNCIHSSVKAVHDCLL